MKPVLYWTSRHHTFISVLVTGIILLEVIWCTTESRRTSESLRRKFNSLCMTKPRSGEICIHLNVERAKAIHNQIMQRAKSNNAEDDDNLNGIVDDDMSNVELDGDSDLNPPCAEIMLCLWLYEFYSHMLSPHYCQL
jgi:hypothetical protein